MNEKFSIGAITSITQLPTNNVGTTIFNNSNWTSDMKLEPSPSDFVVTSKSINPFEVPKKKHNHYFKDVSHLNEIDVYRVIELFGIVDPCLQHALKKLLVTGGRDGNKSKEQDVRDVIASCNRWLEMQAENKK
jgi:hypothetical protein